MAQKKHWLLFLCTLMYCGVSGQKVKKWDPNEYQDHRLEQNGNFWKYIRHSGSIGMGVGSIKDSAMVDTTLGPIKSIDLSYNFRIRRRVFAMGSIAAGRASSSNTRQSTFGCQTNLAFILNEAGSYHKHQADSSWIFFSGPWIPQSSVYSGIGLLHYRAEATNTDGFWSRNYRRFQLTIPIGIRFGFQLNYSWALDLRLEQQIRWQDLAYVMPTIGLAVRYTHAESTDSRPTLPGGRRSIFHF